MPSKMRMGKFNELAPIITARGTSLKLKGKSYKSCVAECDDIR